MAGVLQMVSQLKSSTGLPEDLTENVLHVGFPAADPTSLEIVACLTAFANFYIATAPGATTKMADWMSNELDHSAGAMKALAYFTNDLSGGTPFGSPVGTSTFTLPAPASATQLPEEVAIVCSYNGDLTDVPITEANPTPPPLTIRPAQRRRGRLYFGPLSQGAGFVVSGHYRPSSTLRSDMGLAFVQLATAVASGSTGDLSVWSRADATTYPVVGGYVDDSWDTQRRRGLAPTTRTTFTV